MGVTIVFMICAIVALVFAILWREGVINNSRRITAAFIVITVSFMIRIFSMDHETTDYLHFLSNWVEYFRQSGGFAGLAGEVGNYNLPYLYFLALFSYLKIPDLYMIKLLSIFFDVILAWGVMRTVGLFSQSGTRKLIAFLGTLILPTVVLNGAYWGQCDSIYVAFAVWSIYFALDDRPELSMVFIAISFAFKLQAVFIMPVFFIFLFTNRMKIHHLLIFPLTYLIIIAPAVFMGRPFIETLMLYFNQAGTVGSGLNYNSPSIFAFADNPVNTNMWASLGIAAAFLLILIVYGWLWIRRERVTNDVLLTTTVLFAVGIPLLLPHMHDRYFFPADIFAFIFAAAFPRMLPLPVLVSFASLLGYHAYLRGTYLMPMSYGSIALIIVLVILMLELKQAINIRQQHKT